MIEDILAEEEEHAADLSDLLFVVDPRTGETAGQDPGTNPLQMGRRLETEGSFRMAEQPKQQRVMDNRQAAEEPESGGLRRRAEVAPANEPGTRGRTPRKGSDEEVLEDFGEVRAGEEGGSTRAAHVTNPIRKRKKVA
jgi:hypothetical protein